MSVSGSPSHARDIKWLTCRSIFKMKLAPDRLGQLRGQRWPAHRCNPLACSSGLWAETSASTPGSAAAPPLRVCSNHAEADVSAVANPSTGVDVYDSFKLQELSGWLVFRGTSVATPIITTVYAIAGNASTAVPTATFVASYLYSHTSSLNDGTSGSNGSCGGTDLCTSVAGWDGPTGLGTPNGTSSF